MINKFYFLIFPIFIFGSINLQTNAQEILPAQNSECRHSTEIGYLGYKKLTEQAKAFVDIRKYEEKRRQIAEQERKGLAKKIPALVKMRENLSDLFQDLDIKPENLNFSKKAVPLKDICFGHPIDQLWSLKDFKERKKILKKGAYLKKWGGQSPIKISDYQKVLPSTSLLEVFHFGNKYFVNEGNGRLKAIKDVFLKKRPGTKIEVVVIDFPQKGVQEMLNSLIEEYFEEWNGCKE